MDAIREKFGNRIRIRVCALIYKDDSLLLVQHKGLGRQGNLWAPPGGGLEMNESIHEALKREVLEETGISVKEAVFQFINEYMSESLHAVEIFFHVSSYTGELKRGQDPEMGKNQIIQEVQFVTFKELWIIEEKEKHNILQGNPAAEDLKAIQGYNLFRDIY